MAMAVPAKRNPSHGPEPALPRRVRSEYAAKHESAERRRDPRADGDKGCVVDVYFDDERWSVRYLVVDTGHVMPEHRVLITPQSVVRDQPTDDLIRVRLSRKEVERSPDVDTALPVSLHLVMPQRLAWRDPHLRSCEVIIGYHVHALD